MAKLKKLVRKMLNAPAYLPLEEVRKVLEDFGYELVNQRGSHMSFMNGNGDQITLISIQGKRIARTYVKRVVGLLGLEEWYDEQ